MFTKAIKLSLTFFDKSLNGADFSCIVLPRLLRPLSDKNIKSVNYNVDVVNGIAYLSGIARTEKEMNLVIVYTKETRYINQLVNYIQLSESLSQ